LLFGTDYYDLTQQEFPQFSLFDELEVDADVRRKIGGDNARRLLG
jgi:predicted TIM-barrel fold metal-dependent hydrolase